MKRTLSTPRTRRNASPSSCFNRPNSRSTAVRRRYRSPHLRTTLDRRERLRAEPRYFEPPARRPTPAAAAAISPILLVAGRACVIEHLEDGAAQHRDERSELVVLGDAVGVTAVDDLLDHLPTASSVSDRPFSARPRANARSRGITCPTKPSRVALVQERMPRRRRRPEAKTPRGRPIRGRAAPVERAF